MLRRFGWWEWTSVVGVSVLVLCVGVPVAVGKWTTWRCERDVAAAATTVRTDVAPLRRELTALGLTDREVVEVRWVVVPNRRCEWLPVPGTDLNEQSGVLRLTVDGTATLSDRTTLVRADEAPPREVMLEPLLPRDRSRQVWERDPALDAAFGPPGEARFLIDVTADLVYFTSTADHG